MACKFQYGIFKTVITFMATIGYIYDEVPIISKIYGCYLKKIMIAIDPGTYIIFTLKIIFFKKCIVLPLKPIID